MRRFSLFLLATLALSSCAPQLTAPPDNDPATVTLSQHDGFTFLDFWAGPLPVYDLRIEISYSNLRLNAPAWCKPDAKKVRCTVPTLPAGKNFVLPMT